MEYFTKWHIWNTGKKWWSLLKTRYFFLNEGQSIYANPSDFEAHYRIVLLHGNHIGSIASTPSTSVIPLAVDEDASEDDVEGHLLFITSGTGANQAAQVRDFNTTTKVATLGVGEAFDTCPAVSDNYMIVDYSCELVEKTIAARDSINWFHQKGTPKIYAPLPSDTYGKIEVYPVPDDGYGFQHRYFANLMRIDLTSNLYNLLLRRWQGILTQGVLCWRLSEASDDRYAGEMQIFTAMLQKLKAEESIGHYDQNLQITVSD